MKKLSNEEKYQLVEKYNIDLSKLSRNFIEQPLRIGLCNKVESPSLRDIEYLYLELNLSIENLCKFFSIGRGVVQRLFRENHIRKDISKVMDCCHKTIKEKYNVDNISQNQSIKEKKKQTCLKNSGFEYNLQNPKTREKAKQVYLERWGVEYNSQAQEVKEKKKQTCLKHLGVENPGQSEVVKEKSKQTCLENWGVEYFTQTEQMKEKSKQTCLKNWGVEYCQQCKEIREKGKKTNLERYNCECALQNQQVREKGKKTLLKKLGVDNAGKSKKVHRKMEQTCRARYGVAHPSKLRSIQAKVYSTKKRNGTFGKSKPEDKVYEKLLEKFPDVIRQHRDENRYPFACDFYIPSKDLFIEYNGHWTHGLHPFDCNDENDLTEKQKWEAKANETNFKDRKKTSYLNAVEVWTIRDPLKRSLAKANNLNWVEFFTFDEFDVWFQTIC